MKIQCDVCEKEEASVFCTADEASLCDACDRRVHHANKLASQHPRFSLLHPSSSFHDTDHTPRCDICQERRAFVFCKEDRAILCRECDIPIHKVNEHTQKHNRFLLTGVKLSASASSYQTPSPSPSYSNASSSTTKEKPISSLDHESGSMSLSADGCSGSISDYLMETLPGWHVEDFLDPSGFCKAYNGTTPFTAPADYPETENNYTTTTFLTDDDNMESWGYAGPKHLSGMKRSANGGKCIKQLELQEEQCTVPSIW